MDTPLGPLTLVWSEAGLRGAYFKNQVPENLLGKIAFKAKNGIESFL